MRHTSLASTTTLAIIVCATLVKKTHNKHHDQLKKAQDFVIGTGKIHSVKDFIKIAFAHVKLDYKRYIKIDDKPSYRWQCH